MSSVLELLTPTLRLPGGGAVSTEEYLKDKKTVAFYLSAHWCPPCRGFTPLLTAAYKSYAEQTDNTQETGLIFLSWDHSEQAFLSYHDEMSFPAQESFGEAKLGKRLGRKFGVNGVPSFVVLDAKTGERLDGPSGALTKYGDLRSLVMKHGADLFPFSADNWAGLELRAKEAGQKAVKKLAEGALPELFNGEGEGTSLQQLLGSAEQVCFLFGDGDASDDMYTKCRSVVSEVNADNGDKLACIYIPWTLYDASCDHAKLLEKQKEGKWLALKDDALSDQVKELLTAACGGQVGCPMLLQIKSDTLEVLCVDPGMQQLIAMGAQGYPWTNAKMMEMKEAELKKVENMKAKLFNSFQLFKEEGIIIRREAGAKKDVKMEDLLSGMTDDGVVALYFSAHWCPPCRGFTPILCKLQAEVNAEKRRFEIIFVSSDRDAAAFNGYLDSMKDGSSYFHALDYSSPKYAELKTSLPKIFEVKGIPCLVLMDKTGKVFEREGRKAVGMGPAYFPWNAEMIEKKSKEAEKTEKEALTKQFLSVDRNWLIKRVSGDVGSVKHSVDERKLTFNNFASVYGINKKGRSGETLYYELEFLDKVDCPQFGFGTVAAIEGMTGGEGVGDVVGTYAVDGQRGILWKAGEALKWDRFVGGANVETVEDPWKKGDVIMLALKREGSSWKMASGLNGEWSRKTGFGVHFVVKNDDDDWSSRRHDLMPAFVSRTGSLRYAFEEKDFKYGFPGDEVWAGEEDPSDLEAD